MKKFGKLFNSFSSFLGIVLFAMALVFLSREFQRFEFVSLVKDIQATPIHVIAGALLFTVINHLLLIGYDYLGFRSAGYRFSLKRISLASFVSFVFGNNIGLSGLGSSAVRLRFFKQWNIPEPVTLQVILFCLLSFWVGIFATAGITFLLTPIATAPIPIPHWLNIRLLGAAMTGILILYLFSSLWFKRTIRAGIFTFSAPKVPIAAAQTVVAIADWLFAAAVLYTLLPGTAQTTIDFIPFVSIFMFALIAGFLSNVPGGLGVFETVIIAALSSVIPVEELMKSLILYRFVFFLLPLLAAVVLYAIHELMHVGDLLKGVLEFIIALATDLYPGLLAIGVFLLGMFLFFTAPVNGGISLPLEIHPRTASLFHLLATLGGFSLMISAFWIRRRLFAGLIWVLAVLPMTLFFDLASGMHVETIIICAVVLFFAASAFHWFPRTASVRQYPLFAFILSIGTISAIAFWLKTHAHSLTDLKPDFAWQVEFGSREFPLIPLILTLLAILFIIAYVRMKLKVHDAAAAVIPSHRDETAAVILTQSNPYANLVHLGDKSLHFSDRNDAFIMYRVRGRNWISFGDPIGPHEAARECARQFIEHAAKQNITPVFYEVHSTMLDFYLDHGFSLYKIGEEATVPLSEFTLAGKRFAKIRHILNNLTRKGVSFELIPAGEADDETINQLKAVSEAWLTTKNVGEKGFSLGYFNEEYIRNCSIAVIRRDDRVIAFGNILFSKDQFCLDLMRFIPEENDHLMQYLFVKLMAWGHENGWKAMNLGMAPLSGFYNHATAPIWNRFLWVIFTHGEHLYNFKGLRAFKQQFDPEWESIYVALPKGSPLLLLMIDIATTISGGFRALFRKN